MASIVITFEGFDDMLSFVNMFNKATGKEVNEFKTVVDCITQTNLKKEDKPVLAAQAPVTPVQQAPVAPVQQTPVAPVQQTPVAPVQQVATSERAYSLDEISVAGVTLMDAGKGAELMALLQQFGVESLPQLQPSQYGAFATALREKGAQI